MVFKIPGFFQDSFKFLPKIPGFSRSRTTFKFQDFSRLFQDAGNPGNHRAEMKNHRTDMKKSLSTCEKAHDI